MSKIASRLVLLSNVLFLIILPALTVVYLIKLNSTIQQDSAYLEREVELAHDINVVFSIQKQQQIVGNSIGQKVTTFNGDISATSIQTFFYLVNTLTANTVTLQLALRPQVQTSPGRILDGISTSNESALLSDSAVATSTDIYTLEALTKKVTTLEQAQNEINAFAIVDAPQKVASSLQTEKLALTSKDFDDYRTITHSLNSKIETYTQQQSLALLTLVLVIAAPILTNILSKSIKA